MRKPFSIEILTKQQNEAEMIRLPGPRTRDSLSFCKQGDEPGPYKNMAFRTFIRLNLMKKKNKVGILDVERVLGK